MQLMLLVQGKKIFYDGIKKCIKIMDRTHCIFGPWKNILETYVLVFKFQLILSTKIPSELN